MQIICKKKLCFQDHEIVNNEKTGEKVAILKRSFTVSPSHRPQEVPDWVKTDDLFGMSEDDGTITVVQVLSAPKTNPATKGKAAKLPDDAATDTAIAGWGAKPGSGLPNGNDIGAK